MSTAPKQPRRHCTVVAVQKRDEITDALFPRVHRYNPWRVDAEALRVLTSARRRKAPVHYAEADELPEPAEIERRVSRLELDMAAQFGRVAVLVAGDDD